MNKKISYFDSLVVGITSGCNLRCKYCQNEHFMKKMQEKHLDVMSLEIFEKICKDAFEAVQDTLSERIDFCFTGGEPLLAGVNFFEKIIETQKKYNRKEVRIENTIQTNGTLLNKHWIEVIKRNNLNISVSIDGVDSIHNLQRPMASKDDSFSHVINNIKSLRENQIDFGTISVITEKSSFYPQEIVRFLISLKPKIITFLPCVDSDYTVTAESFSRFMREAFDLWINPDINPESVPIKTFRDTCLHLFGMPKSKDCDYFGLCPRHSNIAIDGTVSICDQYTGKEVGFLGNVMNDTLSSILSSGNALTVYNECRRTPDKCKECLYLNLCNGGCHYRRHMNNGEEPFCNARKEIFSHIIDRISNLNGISKPFAG